MANKKYDYSEDVQQSTETTAEMEEVSAEEMRCQRLEQRNDALANEFRKLKPEIADTHRQLNKLIEGIGAYAGTMLNLHDLLRTSFPIKFTESDRQVLAKEVHTIVDDAISQIRKESDKVSKENHRNGNRISITPMTFWCMIALLMTLVSFFVLIIFANMKLFHSRILTEIITVYAGLIVIVSSIVTIISYKRKD